MPHFSDEFLSELRYRNDIVDVVSQYVHLKKSGSTMKGLCPFHNEKTPSFSVSPDKQLFHCFGCGVGGTVIEFIKLREGLDFHEAVALLAERARMNIPDSAYNDNGIKEKLFAINKEAARYFYEGLRGSEIAQTYLRKRNIEESIVKAFGLGYAKDDWTDLIKHLNEKGYSNEDIYAARLTVKRENGGYYDMFRNRLMFPIIDLRGNVIGFGGRTLGDDKAKYVNSPETYVFNKGRNMFGLNIAKRSKDKQLLIMEGYMDVITMHQYGFKNAIASLGTALTGEQAKLIGRYCGEAVLCYDSDEAGVKAAERALEVLREARVHARVVTVTGAKDPDEFLNKRGADAFLLLLKDSKNSIEYKISKLQENYDLSNTEEKIMFTQKMAEELAKIENVIEREAYVGKLSQTAGISQEAITTEIKNAAYRHEKRIEQTEMRKRERIEYAGAVGKNKIVLKAERLLLHLLCDNSVYKKYKAALSEDSFSVGLHKQLAAVISEMHEKNESADAQKILSLMPTEDISAVSAILLDDRNIADVKKAAADAMVVINENLFNKRKEQLIEKGKIDELQQLLEERRRTKIH